MAMGARPLASQRPSEDHRVAAAGFEALRGAPLVHRHGYPAVGIFEHGEATARDLRERLAELHVMRLAADSKLQRIAEHDPEALELFPADVQLQVPEVVRLHDLAVDVIVV